MDMDMTGFFELYPWMLPVVIFFGRICDVTLGTLRIIFVAKGEKKKAPLVGFFEVFIWVVVISQLFTHANSMIAYLAYAGGYAAGNFVGILVENKIAFGYQLFRIYTKSDGLALAQQLNRNGFGSTHIHGEGVVAEVEIVETVVSRKSGKKVADIIRMFDPNAFYVIEDIRTREKGIFTTSSAGAPRQGK
ncbi:MAG: DUF2179 domain-containing protein [Tannerella sp.]|jgi:uncharacterized protein YebE (UPF0316 family)|nr:DUF2179 domain-containing protein [Tannerella sp.]